MSLCINPRCPQPDHPDNGLSATCRACGSDLLLQGRFRVMRLISSHSGFGDVYEVYERNLPKLLKVLKASHNHNTKVLELFQREAVVLGRLNHPGVPQVEADGYFTYLPSNAVEPLHCIVMEKIDGPNLKQWMVQQGNNPIGEKQALLWLTQLTDVLHLVHQQNYFHRDIKPENIMLRSSGQLVLVDFGAAREITDTYLAQLGASGITAVSSAGYTPPEQEQGMAVPQSDFYALGRTIIYLLTAKAPNDPDIYDSRTNAFHWRSQAPQVSGRLADLIDSLIATRAVDRPQTTQEILERLTAVHAARSSPQSPQDGKPQLQVWPTTTLDANQETAVQTGSFQIQRRWRSRWLIGGVVALSLGVGLVAVGLWLPRQWRPTATTTASVPSQTVQLLKSLLGHERPVNTIVLKQADGRTLISAGADSTIRMWDLVTGAQINKLEGGHTAFINALALSQDESTLFSAGVDKQIVFWDLATGEIIHTIENAHDSAINDLALSPDGQVLASVGADGQVKLWNSETGAAIASLPGHHSSINAVVFSRNGRYLATGGESLWLWNLDTGEGQTLLQSDGDFINRLAITLDNQTLISVGTDKLIRLWQIPSGQPLATLTGHSDIINDVVIARDGQTFYTAGIDHTVRVWDLETLKPLRVLQGFADDVYRMQLRSQDQLITIGGDGGSIKVWLIPPSPSP